jgi:hypothetical protein
MIQTKEELFIAELGGNPQQEIELSYGAKIKITDLLNKYLKAINYTHCCKSDSERKIVRCEDPMVCLRGCSVHEQTCRHPIYER